MVWYSNDPPLNVSRDLFQESRIVRPTSQFVHVYFLLMFSSSICIIHPFKMMYCHWSDFNLLLMQVRFMRKRLVRKTFDMIQELSESESKEVSYIQMVSFPLF